MSLSLADLPTELLDHAVPLIDLEDQVRLSSTYCGAYWCRWSLRMPNYRQRRREPQLVVEYPKLSDKSSSRLEPLPQRVLWSAGAAQSFRRPSKQR